jgi:hypothetical protein
MPWGSGEAMRRRKFIRFVRSAAAWPVVARAQPTKSPVQFGSLFFYPKIFDEVRIVQTLSLQVFECTSRARAFC